MKKLIVTTLMLASATFAYAAGDADAGKAKSQVCAACHGADGNSPAPNFPKLAGQHVQYTVKQLKDMQGDSPARMVPEMSGIVKGLSDQDIEDLAAYYAGKTIKGGAAKKDLAEKGEQVYRAGNMETGVSACTGCHGPAGKGNAGAKYPSLQGQYAAYIEKQLKAFRKGSEEPGAQGTRTNDGETAIMRDVASRMSDLEIRAVASYIEGLR